MVFDRYYKVVPEPEGSDSVPIVASFSTQPEADTAAELLTRESAVTHIVAYHPSSDLVPLSALR